MKELLFSFALLTLFSSAQSQTNHQGMLLELGITSFNMETREASGLGLLFSFGISNFYLNASSNLATGKGDELDFSSSQTYQLNKLNVGVVNVGYIININRFAITPVIGWAYTREIYEDPISFDTWFYGESENSINLGIVGRVNLTDNFGLHTGIGLKEKFKFGLSFLL